MCLHSVCLKYRTHTHTQKSFTTEQTCWNVLEAGFFDCIKKTLLLLPQKIHALFVLSHLLYGVFHTHLRKFVETKYLAARCSTTKLKLWSRTYFLKIFVWMYRHLHITLVVQLNKFYYNTNQMQWFCFIVSQWQPLADGIGCLVIWLFAAIWCNTSHAFNLKCIREINNWEPGQAEMCTANLNYTSNVRICLCFIA